jgi:nucleotide-binding universal stress UspA family protein
MKRIVVGVDGSACGAAALQWATQEAVLRGCDLAIVHGWLLPMLEVDVTGMAMSTGETSGRSIVTDAEAAVHEAAPDLKVFTEVAAASPAAALIEASSEAELVVVGSRGHGAFVGALLGSVSSQVLHHAHCPVVVVRH